MIFRLKLNRNVPTGPPAGSALHSHNGAYGRFSVQQDLSSGSSLLEFGIRRHCGERECRENNDNPHDRHQYPLLRQIGFVQAKPLKSRSENLPVLGLKTTPHHAGPPSQTFSASKRGSRLAEGCAVWIAGGFCATRRLW